jgi:hypothetical protein
MKDIELISYQVYYDERFKNDRIDKLRIDYTCNFEKQKKIKITLEDSIFNVEKQTMFFEPGKGNFFTTFLSTGLHHINNGLQITDSYIHPLILKFIDFETNEIINEYFLDIKFVDISLRGRNTIKRVGWIFGDSHIGHTAQKINYNQFDYSDLYIKPVSKVGLSCNRFSNSNYLEYLSYFPIKDNDIIILNYGEIDIRMAVHVKNFKYGIDKKTILKKVIHNYLTAINTISKKYPKNKIIVLRPNRPFTDSHIIGENSKKEFLFNSNEKDRLILDEMFNNEFLELNKIYNNFEYIDITNDYTCEDGFICKEFLRDNDCHMKPNKNYFDKLNNKLKYYE